MCLSLRNLLFLALVALQIGSVYGPIGGGKRNPYRTYDYVTTKKAKKPTSEWHGSANGETSAWIVDSKKEPENAAPAKTVAECVKSTLSSKLGEGTKWCVQEYTTFWSSEDKSKLFCKLHVYANCRLETKVNEYIKGQKDLDVIDKDGVKYTLSDMRYYEINFKRGFGALGLQKEPGVWKNSYNYYRSNGYVEMAGRATYQVDGKTTTKPFKATIHYGSGYQAITAGPLLYSENHSPQLYVDREGCKETDKAVKVDVADDSELLHDGTLRQRMVSDVCAVLGDTFTEAINDAPGLFEDDKEKDLLKKLAKKVKS